jgi:formate dehydrogenase maturation protein FdhE
MGNGGRCRKRKFRDEIAARLALASTRRQRHTHGEKEEASVYHCPICGSWHMTSQVRRGVKPEEQLPLMHDCNNGND